MQETQVQFLGQEDPLEKEMATHSSTLAWKSPWTEEPGRLQSMRLQSQTWLSDFTFTFMAYASVYITFMNWQNYSDEDQITGFQWLGLFGNIRE